MKTTEMLTTVVSILSCILLLMNHVPMYALAYPGIDELNRSSSGTGKWREAPPTRITMKSTADWARIMFDDEIGNNTNGIRFKYILSYGWLAGNDDDDEISVGKGSWIDVLYNLTVRKTGDIVAFNKQREDFDDTEMYADIVFETDTSMISGYVWLMLAGQGITTFQLKNIENQYVFWQETLPGSGHTRHLRRYILLDSFHRQSEISPTSVVSLALIALLVTIILSPIIPHRKKTFGAR